MYPLIVLVHVVAIVIFAIAHAISAAAMFQVRAEPDRAKLEAILNRSGQALMIAGIAVLVALVAGIVLGFMGNWWGQLWIWVSLVLIIVVGGAMTPLAGSPMTNVRTALGMQVGKPKPGDPPPVALSDSEIAAARAALKPELVAILGVGAYAIITWLMLTKPF